MAKIHEEVLVVKLSQLVRNDSEEPSVITEEIVAALEQVVQELVGQQVIVEVEQA